MNGARAAIVGLLVCAGACRNFEKVEQECLESGRCSNLDGGAGGGVAAGGGGSTAGGGGSTGGGGGSTGGGGATGGGGGATGGGGSTGGGGGATGGGAATGGGGAATGGGTVDPCAARAGDAGVVQIFRSIGQAAALATGAGNAMTIAQGEATFAAALPDRASVGDALQYGKDGGSDIDSIAFIQCRIDARHYLVRTERGAVPANVAAASTGWALYRAYIDLWKMIDASEQYPNSNIAPAVSQFDQTDGGRDLVGTNTSWNVAISGDSNASTLAISLGHWRTDPDHYVRLFAPQSPEDVGVSQRHSGSWDNTKARIVGASDYPMIQGYFTNFWVEGLQIKNSDVVPVGMKASGIGLYGGNGNVWRIIDNLVVWGGSLNGGSADGLGYVNGSGRATAYFVNNIVYGWPGSGIGAYSPPGLNVTIVAYNNTVLDNAHQGFDFGCDNAGFLTVLLVNNLVTGNDGGDYGAWGPVLKSGSNNLSGDTSAIGDAGNRLNATVVFKSVGQDDYRLSNSDSAAKGAGKDLSADPLFPFDTDIAGQPRTAPWDIGASIAVP